MDKLAAEIQAVRDRKFRLEFTVPTAEQLAKLRQIHRERTADERARIRSAEKALNTLLRALERGDLSPSTLSPEQRAALAKHLDVDSGLVDDTE